MLFILICIIIFIIIKCILYIYLKKLINKNKNKNVFTIGFFHPYCNAGGGGERVLWCAIRSLIKSPFYIKKKSIIKIIIYTGGIHIKSYDILKKTEKIFGITFPKDIYLEFIYLSKRSWIEAKKYPKFTLIGQSIGSIILIIEALLLCKPDILIDTTGFAFIYPFVKCLAQSKVFAYVHYPTISSDMLHMVNKRENIYNNNLNISSSLMKSTLKLIYYHLFSIMYGLVGRCADQVLVNSTWTKDHILNIWKCSNKLSIMYPPCQTKCFEEIKMIKNNVNIIISISQFRPEKNQLLQLIAFSIFLHKDSHEFERKKTKLILLGSCRNDEDEKRVAFLKKESIRLNIDKNVEFRLNASFDEMKNCLSIASIGLHTMWNEHFGIGIVEMMAAGLIVIANNSGGPKLDILADIEKSNHKTPLYGYLAITAEEYANAMDDIIFVNNKEINLSIRQNARERAKRFSDEVFEEEILRFFEPVLTNIPTISV